MKTRQLVLAFALGCSLPATAIQVLIPPGATMTVPVQSTVIMGCADLTVQGTLNANSTIGTTGNVTIAAGGTLDAGASVLTVGGNWSKAHAGTFVRGGSTVIFADGCSASPAVITGFTAFTNLMFLSSSGRTITLPVGGAVSVANTLTVQGSGPPIHIASAALGQAARIGLANGAVSNVTNATIDVDVAVVAFAGNIDNLSLMQAPTPSPAFTGKDVVYVITLNNAGANTATGVTVTDLIPAGTTLIWASPGCTNAAGTVTCNVGSLASGANAVVRIVVRPTAAGTITNDVAVNSSVADFDVSNNVSLLDTSVSASAAGVPVQRYRLYSDVTKEHHFTTDLNEYNTLGSYVGTWVQEGGVGKVLNNPGSFAAVTAMPYYRLYDTTTQWHHWTTDANENYTLGYVYAGWNMEGVDGYILPSNPAGTIQLYRLNYPPLGSLHHWTIDANEYTTLIAVYGWVGEGGSGFVIQ